MIHIVTIPEKQQAIEEAIGQEYRLQELVTLGSGGEIADIVVTDVIAVTPDWANRRPPVLFPPLSFSPHHLLGIVYALLGNYEKAYPLLAELPEALQAVDLLNRLQQGIELSPSSGQDRYSDLHNQAISYHYTLLSFSGQALEQAQRQLDRLQTLRASGMASMQALEDTEARRDAARSEQAAAQARVAQARQQLQRTEVRAPFDGVVSERRVSVGDTAQVGRELLKVIDPRRLRIEGVLPAEAAATLRIGQTVSYRVQGQDGGALTGTLRRISPAAQAATRQVEVLVDVDPATPARLAGLYVEGRVHAGEGAGLVLPASAVVAEGSKAWAWKIDGQRLRKVPVDLEARDARRGRRRARPDAVAVAAHPAGRAAGRCRAAQKFLPFAWPTAPGQSNQSPGCCARPINRQHLIIPTRWRRNRADTGLVGIKAAHR